MNKVRRNTEQAMVELLKGSGASNTTERPSRLVLPGELYDSVLSTVEQSQDGRERSTGFNHINGAWVTVKQKVGEEGRVSTRPYYFRPHIRMHTHPKPDMEAEDVAMKALGIKRSWSGDKTTKMIAANRQAYEGYYKLPSSDDIAIVYPRSTGIIGNMIASEGGIFFSLRNDLTDKESVSSSHWSNAQEVATEYDARITEAVNMYMSTEDTTAFVLNAAAKALAHKYTIYFSQDIESPELSRVDLVQ